MYRWQDATSTSLERKKNQPFIQPSTFTMVFTVTVLVFIELPHSCNNSFQSIQNNKYTYIVDIEKHFCLTYNSREVNLFM